MDLTTTITFEGDVLLGKLNPDDLTTGVKKEKTKEISFNQAENNLSESDDEEGSTLASRAPGTPGKSSH